MTPWLTNPCLSVAAFLDDDASPAFKTKLIPKLLRLYPDDPAIGSPYAPVNASKSDRFYGPKNQYKRVASILGDTVFNSGWCAIYLSQHSSLTCGRT